MLSRTDTITAPKPGSRVRVIAGELSGREAEACAPTGWLPSGCIEVRFDGDRHNTALPIENLITVG